MPNVCQHAAPLLLLSAALGLGTVGCSRGPTLTFKSDPHNSEIAFQELRQRFTIAALSTAPGKDYDVVLVAVGTEGSRRGPARADLIAVATPPIRQVVHIRLHWRPYPGAGPDNPANSNASVRWILYPTSSPTNSPGQAADQLDSFGNLKARPALDDVAVYEGTAFIKPHFEPEGCTLEILGSSLRPAIVRGDMTDILGNATLTGTFFAPYNSATVTAVLRDLPSRADALAGPAVTPPAAEAPR